MIELLEAALGAKSQKSACVGMQAGDVERTWADISGGREGRNSATITEHFA